MGPVEKAGRASRRRRGSANAMAKNLPSLYSCFTEEADFESLHRVVGLVR